MRVGHHRAHAIAATLEFCRGAVARSHTVARALWRLALVMLLVPHHVRVMLISMVLCRGIAAPSHTMEPVRFVHRVPVAHRLAIALRATLVRCRGTAERRLTLAHALWLHAPLEPAMLHRACAVVATAGLCCGIMDHRVILLHAHLCHAPSTLAVPRCARATAAIAVL